MKLSSSFAGSREAAIRRSAGLAIWSVAVLMLVACGSDTAAPADSTVSEQPTETSTGAETDGPPANLSFDSASSVVIPNSPGTLTTTGRQRVMTALLSTESARFLGGPDLPVTIVFEAVNGDDRGEAEGTWLTTDAAALGLYVSHFDFPSPGLWEIAVISEDTEVARGLFEITETSPVPTNGDPAPATDSPTATTPADISAISTDLDPDPGFYDLSIADAVANGKPTVIAFVTPAFCQTALCGPTLDAVKGAVAGRDDIDVVHVEPFDLELATEGTLQPIASMDDWGLQTEPWVFVVDAEGIVAATFEGIMGQDEIRAAIDELG